MRLPQILLPSLSLVIIAINTYFVYDYIFKTDNYALCNIILYATGTIKDGGGGEASSDVKVEYELIAV